jgi:hypothetical protein
MIGLRTLMIGQRQLLTIGLCRLIIGSSLAVFLHNSKICCEFGILIGDFKLSGFFLVFFQFLKKPFIKLMKRFVGIMTVATLSIDR